MERKRIMKNMNNIRHALRFKEIRKYGYKTNNRYIKYIYKKEKEKE
jgi:hypothetical protein